MNIIFVKTYDHQAIYYEQFLTIFDDNPKYALTCVLVPRISLGEKDTVVKKQNSHSTRRRIQSATAGFLNWIYNSSLGRRIRKNLKNSGFYYLARYFLYWHWARRKVFSGKPDLIVLCEDNSKNQSAIVTHMAHRRGVPFIVFPIYPPQPLEFVKFYAHEPAHKAGALTRLIVKALYPADLLRFKSIQLVAHPLGHVIARWLLRQHRGQPWILNSGFASKIMVEGDATKTIYGKLGFRPEKIVVTGALIDDELFRQSVAKRTSVTLNQKKVDFDECKPTIVCALPPNQYTGGAYDLQFEYGSFRELCVGWLESLQSVSEFANVLVSLHPRTQKGLIEDILPAGVHIIDEPLSSIIVLADLYVACVSSTIRWALALGIPVINYDTFRYDYGDFASGLGCIEVSSQHVFRQVLSSCLNDKNLSRIRTKAQSDAQKWGRVDGKVGERIHVHLKEILSRNESAVKVMHTHKSSFRLQDF